VFVRVHSWQEFFSCRIWSGLIMFLPPVARSVIYIPAKLYELGVRTRVALFKNRIFETRKLNTPVISVGNLTVGGAGKTPCVAFLARFLIEAGHSVAVLSRGYKRESEGRVEVSNGREILCDSNVSGDEPFLLANSCPGARVVVDSDRYAAGRWLEERAQISVFILDDGFQHLRLARDLNILLIDATEPLDQAKMIPFGRLREPLEELRRADAFIVTKSDRSFDRQALENTIRRFARENSPIFYAYHRMTNLIGLSDSQTFNLSTFARRPIAAISGIARPESFIADLERLDMKIAFRRDYTDHHRYTREELLEIVELSRQARAEAIITTEKDAANLPAGFAALSAIPILAARIEFSCENEAALKELALRSMRLRRE
jgi:tetraacyldisaccharide 4'-kinase